MAPFNIESYGDEPAVNTEPFTCHRHYKFQLSWYCDCPATSCPRIYKPKTNLSAGFCCTSHFLMSKDTKWSQLMLQSFLLNHRRRNKFQLSWYCYCRVPSVDFLESKMNSSADFWCTSQFSTSNCMKLSPFPSSSRSCRLFTVPPPSSNLPASPHSSMLFLLHIAVLSFDRCEILLLDFRSRKSPLQLSIVYANCLTPPSHRNKASDSLAYPLGQIAKNISRAPNRNIVGVFACFVGTENKDTNDCMASKTRQKWRKWMGMQSRIYARGLDWWLLELVLWSSMSDLDVGDNVTKENSLPK